MANPQHFVFALVDEFTHIAFSCAVEPLRIANLVSGRELYSWSFASADGVKARSSNGIETLVQHRFNGMPAADRLFVLSGIRMHEKDHRSLIAALRRARAQGTPLGALCSGAYILAKAGFLDGLPAAIHWHYHDLFAEEFPQVRLVRSVFVSDERIITASGGTAAADLMLHLIERDHGCDLSFSVADQMVYNAVRSSGSSQRVSLQYRNGIRNAHLVKAIDMMRAHIEDPVSAADLAREIGITPRQVQRLFEKHLDTTPRKYFTELRLERARHLIQQTERAITDIAVACGFASLGHFSRLYKAFYGQAPSRARSTP